MSELEMYKRKEETECVDNPVQVDRKNNALESKLTCICILDKL